MMGAARNSRGSPEAIDLFRLEDGQRATLRKRVLTARVIHSRL
jgi:hypothetical protein